MISQHIKAVIIFIAGFGSGYLATFFSPESLHASMTHDSSESQSHAGSTRFIENQNHDPSHQESLNSLECTNWESPPVLHPTDPWLSMKAINRPAPCTVKGFAIEELDSANNFRRLYTLGFSGDVESKVGVLAYMLAAQDVTL